MSVLKYAMPVSDSHSQVAVTVTAGTWSQTSTYDDSTKEIAIELPSKVQLDDVAVTYVFINDSGQRTPAVTLKSRVQKPAPVLKRDTFVPKTGEIGNDGSPGVDGIQEEPKSKPATSGYVSKQSGSKS
jgi:hypothetical protein